MNEIIKEMSERYARNAYLASGVNPNLVQSVVFEALIEYQNKLNEQHKKNSTVEVI